MWSNQTIQDLAEEHAADARALGLKPQPVEQALKDFKSNGRFSDLPFLGDYTPEGWERKELTFFVDATGRGNESELALTIPAFIKKLEGLNKSRDHYAVAIREAGQFQIVIGVYRPDYRDFTHTGALTESELRKVAGKR